MRRPATLVLLWFSAYLILLSGSLIYGQDATGRIVGSVSDPSGAAISDARVTILNLGTQLSQTTSSDKDGLYQVLSLPIGSYMVTIEHAGFGKHIFDHEALQINQSLRLDARLEVGAPDEVVEVKDQAPNVETVNQTIGTSVVGETIRRAPLNGRNVLDLALLQPGVTETNGGGGSFSVAGGRSDSVTYLLNGDVNNDLLFNGIVYNPNPDTIAEFRILESNYSAEYGRNGGGIISVVTKSGTNQWHGSAFDFLRNDAFNANSYFNNANGLSRDVLKRNQYGGTLGGPITLPKLVSGKERFFFFVGYQGQRQSRQRTSGLGSVFTPAQLNGDFSGGGQPGNCPNADPSVAAFLQQNPFFQANAGQAACAIIDPTKVNPVSLNFIKAGLIPTSPLGAADYQAPQTDNTNELTMKFDFLIRANDKISATLGGFRNPQSNPFDFASVPGYTDLTTLSNYFANAAYLHVFTPNSLNEFRLFIQRHINLQEQPATKLPTPAQLGVGITSDDPTGPPNLVFDNGFATGFSELGPTRFVDNTFGASDVFTHIHGKHNWKTGGGVSTYQNNTVYDFFINGELDFSGQGGSGTGNSFADFFLGIPTSFFQFARAPSNIRSKSYYGFLQDEWRIAKRLTLNFGVRYEYNSPKLDTEGRTLSVIPGLQSKVFVNAPKGLVFPGDPGSPRGLNFPDRNDWAPRVGFAWDVTGNGKTSVRGGFGLFYDILKGEDSFNFNGAPPFFAAASLAFPTVSNQTSNVAYLSDPFGSTGTVNPFPSHPPPPNLDFAAAGLLPFNSGGSIFLVDPHLHTPYTYQYNLSVQHEIAANTTLEASYVASSSHGLTGAQDINPFVLGTTDRVLNLSPGNSSCVDENNNSTSGVSPNATCSFATLPEFKNIAKANYNSLQASLTRQLSDARYIGHTYFTLAYTLAHNIDNVSGFQERNWEVPSYQPNLRRASGDQDVRHRITFSGGWDLPFDRMWKSGSKRLTQGWSLFPIVTWHTGFPFDVRARLADRFNPGAEGPSGAGDLFLINANIAGPTNTLDPRRVQDFGNGPGHYWINPKSFTKTNLPTSAEVIANPSRATYGSLPRNFLRGPGFTNFDFAFSKTTNLYEERLNLEFRAEFFNIFNHANFNIPVTNINNGQFFGQVDSTFPPRIIQLALRLSF